MERFADQIKSKRNNAIARRDAAINAVTASCNRIDPDQGVLNELLAVYSTKSEKPFDEMVIACVLHRASELHARGEADIVFCNVNKKDFSPKPGSSLAARYPSYGIDFRDNFRI